MPCAKTASLAWFLLLVSLPLVLRFAVLPAASLVTGSDKAFPHRPLVSSPYIPRLTSTRTNSEFGKRLIGLTGDLARTFHQQAPGATYEGVTFLLDPSWRRILYTQDLAVIKDWGDDDPDPARRLRCGMALVTNSGQWSSGDRAIQVFVAELGPPRIIRLGYDYGTNTMSWNDSLSLATDSLRLLLDIDLDDNGTRGDVADDTICALDGRFDSPRVILYPCSGGTGARQQYFLPLGTGSGQISTAKRIAVGREMFGSNTKEIYVLDARGKVVQYHRVGGALQFENEFSFGFHNGVRTEIVNPRDITIDCYGQVYVISDMPGSRIYKLTPDLQFLDVFVSEGEGDDQMLKPLAISNSRPTQDAMGFDDLQLTEYWSDVSGGQRYAIGIKDSLVGAIPASHYFDLTYIATDPHWLTLNVEKWTGSAWSAYSTWDYDFRFSGTTEVRWGLPGTEWGYDHQYRLRFITKSTYTPLPGTAGEPFADTMTYEATMGNEKPTILVPLSLSGLQGGCIVEGVPHMASVSAQDDDTPGSLTYTWTDLGGRARFYDPSTYSYVSTLTGPWGSVELHVSGGAVSLAELLPPVDISVTVTDAGGGSVATDKVYGVCSYGGPCDCAPPCDCPSQGDVVFNGLIDVNDVLQTIKVAFVNGVDVTDPSCPASRCDVNNSGFVDAADVLWIIKTAFTNGPGPTDPCGP